MDGAVEYATLVVIVFSTIYVDAVPPAACFSNFRWDDCGRPPTPVMYYWKPGSRCEVGIWRGCLPNLNMFHDEYECINTCIFVARAQPDDYHEHLKIPEAIEETTSNDTFVGNMTDFNVTEALNDTSVSEGLNATDAGGGNGTEPSEAATEGEDTTLAEI